jgi:hypothetical protein
VRIALIQTCAAGDIVIALPIAQHFVSQGHQVVWPIDEIYIEFFKEAAPEIDFMPVFRDRTGVQTLAYFITFPLQIADHFGCEKKFILYSKLGEMDLGNGHLAKSLKFDELKYAVTGVPFVKKWDLEVVRNHVREQELLDHLDLSLAEDFVVVQDACGDQSQRVSIEISQELRETCRIIPLQILTKSPFDWIPVFERAKELFLIDSAPANIIEQLRIKTKRTLYLRSGITHTPVFAQGWDFK